FEVLHVADLHGHVDPAAHVLGGGLHRADVGVHPGDLGADRGHHALLVLHLHRQPDGERAVVLTGAVPLHLDAAVRVVHQVDDVRAGRRVHRHTLAAADVADDLLAAN